jgi:hypothetical protein
MAHFSPVNGAFPHKDQIDRTCLVAADEANQKIERGMIVVVNKDGEFEIAKDASVGPLYFALQAYDNLQAAMAGRVGIGKGVKVPGPTGAHQGEEGHRNAPSGQPAITGLSFQEHGNYQTDMYDHDEEQWDIGDKLTVKDGYFVKAGDGDEAVATVYAAPAPYYANDAVLVPGWSTGAWIKVLRVSL